jgi:hypothetical protein
MFHYWLSEWESVSEKSGQSPGVQIWKSKEKARNPPAIAISYPDPVEPPMLVPVSGILFCSSKKYSTRPEDIFITA